MELRKIIYLTLFAYGAYGIPTDLDKSAMEKTDLMPSTTSGKTSSVLREILNQESLVRFSMVQKIQKLVMDVIDNTDSAQNVKKRLQEAIKDLQSLESKEQDLEIENANFSQKLNALNEAMKIHKNIAMGETKNITQLIAELKSKSDNFDKRLQNLKSNSGSFIVSVNETLKDIRRNQKANNMQLLQISSQLPKECTPAKFGANCDRDCGHCKDAAPCDFVYGTCALGCSKGWTGIICTEQCPSGKYGDRCSETCGHCSGDVACDFVNGFCSEGCLPGWGGYLCKEAYLTDCQEILDKGKRISGIYKIYPWNNSTFKEVLCDMDSMGGGWTVFQKRLDGSVSFSRNWIEYQNGFGNVSTEYWLGNDALHALTLNSSSLYVKLQHTNGRHYFQYYSDFRITGAEDDYRLHLGSYSNGTAGEMLTSPLNNKTFKTPDHSSQRSLGCFRDYTEGGWWFAHCHNVYLNGVYGSGKWANPWYPVITSGTIFRSSQMMTKRH